jgi:DNA-directed RNA polymerase subunit beta'
MFDRNKYKFFSYFYFMIDQYKHKQLQIGLVSPQQIKAWAKKILPNGEVVGEVTRPSTFHYKTDKPEKDGLFCERIFGPIKSGICACGNGEQVLSRDIYRLGHRFDFFRMLSCYFTTVGFYISSMVMYIGQ